MTTAKKIVKNLNNPAFEGVPNGFCLNILIPGNIEHEFIKSVIISYNTYYANAG